MQIRHCKLQIVFLGLVVFIGCRAQPRYDSHIDFPIVTQFPDLGGTEADRRRKDPPGWGNYSAVVTDHTAPSWDRVVRAVQRWENQGGCPVDVYNSMGSLRSGVARVQVVNNVAIGQSLWTFFVGPNWKQDGGPYVLVVSGRSGTSSNSSSAYGGTGPLKLPDGVAQSGTAGYPFILAFVNQGGRESQGNHPDVLKSVEKGIAFAKAQFGVDDQKVVFAGKSRGAASALMWGANPLGLAYKTAGIFAHAAPTNYGTVCDQPNGTYPGLGGLVVKELARKPNWIPDQAHAERMQVLRDCMAGSQDPDTMRSRSQIAQVERFRDVYLAVGLGTHDPGVGIEQGFDFCQTLDSLEVDYFVEFTLGGGHKNSQGVKRAFDLFMRRLVMGEIDEELLLGRTWNREAMRNERTVYSEVEDGSPVWTVFPEITTANRENAVYVGAPDGSEVYILVKTADGDAVWMEYDGKIEWDYVRVDLPKPPGPGRYRWTIFVGNVEIPDEAILKHGKNGKPLPPETLVLTEERFIHELAQDTHTFGHVWVWPY